MTTRLGSQEGFSQGGRVKKMRWAPELEETSHNALSFNNDVMINMVKMTAMNYFKEGLDSSDGSGFQGLKNLSCQIQAHPEIQQTINVKGIIFTVSGDAPYIVEGEVNYPTNAAGYLMPVTAVRERQENNRLFIDCGIISIESVWVNEGQQTQFNVARTISIELTEYINSQY